MEKSNAVDSGADAGGVGGVLLGDRPSLKCGMDWAEGAGFEFGDGSAGGAPRSLAQPIALIAPQGQKAFK